VFIVHAFLCTHAHTHPFNGPFSGTTQVSRYQRGKTSLDFTEASDSEWQWHQLGRMQVSPRSRQITMPAPHHSVFLQAGCPSCRPTNSVKALKAFMLSFNYCKIKKLPLLTSSELESFNYILHQKLKKIKLRTSDKSNKQKIYMLKLMQILFISK